MCQIAYAPRKEMLTLEMLEASMDNNPHGFGIAYARDNRLWYCKKLADFPVFKTAFDRVPEDSPLAIHFRWATHGDKGKDNIHPFEVLSVLQGDPMDLCMAHNGTVGSIHESGSNKSDTLMYVEKILRPILKKHPELILDPAFQLLLARDIGGHNKFMFLRGDGQAVFINKKAGHIPKEQPDSWWANDYSFKSAYRSTKHKSFTGSEQYYNEWRDRINHNTGASARNPVGQTSSNVCNISEPKQSSFIEPTFNPPGDPTNYYDLMDVEENPPEALKIYLKPGEVILKNRYANTVSLMGYGWVKAGTTVRWDQHLSHGHKKWVGMRDGKATLGHSGIIIPNSTSSSTKSPVGVVVENVEAKLALAETQMTDLMEKTYDSKDFRLLNPRETLDWVLRFPDEAAEWAEKNGFFGSAKRISQYMQDTNGGIDAVSEFIYKKARGQSVIGLDEVRVA